MKITTLSCTNSKGCFYFDEDMLLDYCKEKGYDINAALGEIAKSIEAHKKEIIEKLNNYMSNYNYYAEIKDIEIASYRDFYILFNYKVAAEYNLGYDIPAGFDSVDMCPTPPEYDPTYVFVTDVFNDEKVNADAIINMLQKFFIETIDPNVVLYDLDMPFDIEDSIDYYPE